MVSKGPWKDLAAHFEYHPRAVEGKNTNELWTSFPAERGRLTVFGKPARVPRDEVVMSRSEVVYHYSNHTVPRCSFTPVVEALRLEANRLATVALGRPVDYTWVLLNGYRDGQDGVGWHADDEPTIDPSYPIVSLSFGASRDFDVKRLCDGRRYRITLHDGDALIMLPGAQALYQHQVPKRAHAGPRLNLTFRVHA